MASVWGDIFHHPDDESVFDDTVSCIRWMYRQLEYGYQTYPGFFTHHSMGFMQEDAADGKIRMHHAWQHILDQLCMVLKRDPQVRADAFTEQFSAEQFAEVLLSLMLSAVIRQDFDPSAVLEMTRRTLY